VSGSTASELALQLAALRPVFAAARVDYAMMGGAAVMTYGLRARTRDLDFLVAGGDDALTRVATAAAEHGWRVERKSGWHIRLWRGAFFSDVVAGATELEHEAVRRASVRLLADQPVSTIAAEHLCALKLLAGRPRDLRDVGELHDAWVALDVALVNALLRPFAVQWTPQPGEATPTLVDVVADD
jgi:hypothetical protein